ncbi:MAG: D-tyrosyl-tRNA(Tyr) deacylase, partial [Ruminococcus sp.]|nr:D-tyrosyl-tRNA(Tyr) deacylase [Candidatus Copronaster equi]
RVFEDENGEMNLSAIDIDGEVLAISQFTHCADIKKGNRPSFTGAAQPDYANELYEYFQEQLKANGIKNVEHGLFGEDMKVDIQNDGPVTILMDSTIWKK